MNQPALQSTLEVEVNVDLLEDCASLERLLPRF